MRIRSTIAFSEARAIWDSAHRHRHEKRDATDVDDSRRDGFLSSATERLLKVRAATGNDIIEKLTAMLENVGDDDFGFGWREIERDLAAMDRPQPGPQMHNALNVWREAWLNAARYDENPAYTDDEGSRLGRIVSSAVEAILRVPCTTAGDFMVKAYAHLIWHAGNTNTLDIRAGGTGNIFDVNLHEIDSNSVVTDEYFRSIYDDLDHSDLGACLLATGLIDFDAKAWIERAESIGMSVTLMFRDGQRKGLAIGMTDSDSPRLRREERRLQRILTFDHEARWAAVSDFIEKHRHDLVCHATSNVQVAA